MDSVTITGIREIENRLQNITSPQKRRKVLQKTSRLIVKNAKQRLTNQVDFDGVNFAPRSQKTPANLKNKKMERGLKKVLTAVFADDKKAIIGFKKGLERYVAYQQQTGLRQKKQVVKGLNPKKNLPASIQQARQLAALGYKAGNKTVGIGYIQRNLTRGKAGTIIRIMKGLSAKSSYDIVLPARTFLGVTAAELAQIHQIIITEINAP